MTSERERRLAARNAARNKYEIEQIPNNENYEDDIPGIKMNMIKLQDDCNTLRMTSTCSPHSRRSPSLAASLAIRTSRPLTV